LATEWLSLTGIKNVAPLFAKTSPAPIRNLPERPDGKARSWPTTGPGKICTWARDAKHRRNFAISSLMF
jgi:hypothetical protein